MRCSYCQEDKSPEDFSEYQRKLPEHLARKCKVCRRRDNFLYEHGLYTPANRAAIRKLKSSIDA